MNLLLLRRATTAAATALLGGGAGTFLFMDANPSLWFYDKFFLSESRFHHQFGGKRIWITGASSGIGAELAKQLSICPNVQLILSGRSMESLQRVATQCREHDENACVQLLPFNIETDDLQKTVDKALELCENTDGEAVLDIVFLNAGMGQLSLAVDTSPELTQRLWTVNTWAPIAMTQRLLSRQPHAPLQLVVTSSVAAKMAVPLSAAYAATKHALMGFFNSLATEVEHVRIDLPCPGPVQSNFFKRQQQETDSETSSIVAVDNEEASQREWKMSASRCARLILSSLVMPSGGGETWMAQQPTLFFLFLNQYAPKLAQWILRTKLGPTRVAMFQEGLNLYDPQSISKLRSIQEKKNLEDDTKT